VSKTIRAAGGVVVLQINGEPRVLITHRPHYDDWSIPKGKRDPGESDELCALREVFEETGLQTVLHEELPVAKYTDHKGRPKTVRYWRMSLDLGHHDGDAVPEFVPNDEVDEIRWLSPDEAISLLHYAHDQALISHLFPAAGN
jgi:8-oxo-dGTP pyrophosphatase MutT (NUDIX family)